MRVMTFNLRFENERDGENAWYYRREMIVRMIHQYSPDILGTQEGKWDQLMYLRRNLPAYAAHMPEREEDRVIQCPTLFVKKDRFVISGGRDFWLSKTPEVHLSKDWDSAFPRMISYAELELTKKESRSFCAAVTHLDHKGEQARFHQAEIIAQWAKDRCDPLVLMGDFNEAPDADVYRVLTDPQVGLFDTWRVLEGGEGPESFTHHAFTGSPTATRMDWILVSSALRVSRVSIIKYQENGYYPSDHFPYMADLEWRK